MMRNKRDKKLTGITICMVCYHKWKWAVQWSYREGENALCLRCDNLVGKFISNKKVWEKK